METTRQHIPEFTVTEAEFVAFSVYTAKDSRFHRRRFRLGLVAASLTLLGLFAWNFIGGIDWERGWDPVTVILVMAVTLVFLVVVLLGWFVIAPLVLRMQGRMRFRGKGYETMRGPTRFELAEAGLRVQGKNFDSLVRWPAIIEAVVAPGVLYLYTSPIQGFLVPKRAFPDTATFDAFVATVQEHRAHSQAR